MLTHSRLAAVLFAAPLLAQIGSVPGTDIRIFEVGTPSVYGRRGPAFPNGEIATAIVSGIDPGWGNDVLPVLVSGLASTIDQVRCREIFDYATYDQPDAVRFLVGMGQPMDEVPPMVAPTVPTMVWGGQVRLIASHQDQVAALPPGATLVASSTFCPVAAFTVGDTVFCIQPHPEFEEALSAHLLDKRRSQLGEAQYQSARNSLALGHEGADVARMMVDFLGRR